MERGNACVTGAAGQVEDLGVMVAGATRDATLKALGSELVTRHKLTPGDWLVAKEQ